jgi:hypothetical protein
MNFTTHHNISDLRGNLQLALICLGLSLALSVVLSGGRQASLPSQVAAGISLPLVPAAVSSLPQHPAVAVAEAAPSEEPADLQPAESRLLPLRGAPAWVWDLPAADPRRVAADKDWDVVAAADRRAGLIVLDWTGRVIPEEEYWNGLCQRWIDDPQWGGVQP